MEKDAGRKTKKQMLSEKLQEKWRPIVFQWRVSGQTQRGFCQAHKLNFDQLTYWKRKFLGTTPKRGPKIVKVSDSDVDKSLPSPSQEPECDQSGIRVFFRDFCLEVKPDFSEEVLLKLVQALRRA